MYLALCVEELCVACLTSQLTSRRWKFPTASKMKIKMYLSESWQTVTWRHKQSQLLKSTLRWLWVTSGDNIVNITVLSWTANFQKPLQNHNMKENSVAWVCERTISAEQPPLVKLVPTFVQRECYMVSVTDTYDRILGFLDRSCYFFFQVAPQLYSRGWADLVPDPLLLLKSDSAGNRTRTSGPVARNSDH
jgi:hypothetical protein